jgi:hypothetical protein
MNFYLTLTTIFLVSKSLFAQYQMIGKNESQISSFAESSHYTFEKIKQTEHNFYILVTLKSHTAAFYFNGAVCDKVAIFPSAAQDYHFAGLQIPQSTNG